MIYLSGCSAPRYERAIIDLGIGLLIQPGSYKAERVRPFAAWAADNGCCTIIDGIPSRNPEWSCAKWARMLGALWDLSAEDRGRCLFVLAPDYPCDHDATLAEFQLYLPILRGFGFPIAFAIQNGATVDTVPWDDFDVAFLAGDTEWKCGPPAYEMAVEARNRGKWVHMGRVNSWDRLDWASTIGCDSSDGTFMKHGKPEDMTERLAVWLANNSPRLTQMGAAV